MAGERLTALLNEREQQREAQRKAQMAAQLQAEEQRQLQTARLRQAEQQQQRAAIYNRVQQAITAKQQGDERTMEQIRRDPEFLKRREERTVGMGALGRWATNTARGTGWEEPVRTTFGTAGNIVNGLLGGGATLRAAGNQLQADLFRDQEAYQRAEWLRNEASHLQGMWLLTLSRELGADVGRTAATAQARPCPDWLYLWLRAALPRWRHWAHHKQGRMLIRKRGWRGQPQVRRPRMHWCPVRRKVRANMWAANSCCP